MRVDPELQLSLSFDLGCCGRGCGISIYRYYELSFFYKYRLLDIEIFDISEYRYFSVLSISRLHLYV